jgi:CRISPR-associated protein Cas2
MDILITYDVNTQDKDGRRRLRHVAKECKNFGQRVQYSVFECTISEVQMEVFRARLLNIIKSDEDSLRIYRFRGGREGTVESYGIDKYVDFNDPLIV